MSWGSRTETETASRFSPRLCRPGSGERPMHRKQLPALGCRDTRQPSTPAGTNTCGRLRKWKARCRRWVPARELGLVWLDTNACLAH